MSEDYVNPASTVDLIVPYNEGIVLVRRKNEPFKEYWALPGGFLENGKETLEEAAARELFEETGIITNPRKLRLIGVYSEPKRDPRGHVISHVYEVREYSGKLSIKEEITGIRAFRKLPTNLAFDHSRILWDYFKNEQFEGRI